MTAGRIMVDISLDEVRALVERTKGLLTDEDYDQLARLVDTLIELTRLVRQKGTTIARLRRVFGLSTTEKTAAVLDNGASTDSDGEDETNTSTDHTDEGGEASDRKQKKRRKGHGRIPTSDYDAEHIPVPHDKLHAGDVCPCCARGRLCSLEPAQWLRIFGQPPLTGKCWDCERMRCATCGEVFTARAPEEAQGPKYDESAASMMGLLRYGTGLPLFRLGRLQQLLGIPVPPSTQWEVVAGRLPALLPVYEALLRCAAAGSVVHNDDTYMRILEFMGKRRAKLLAKGELPDPDRTGLFTTAIVSVTTMGPIAMFFTGRKHAGENLTTLLDDRPDGLEQPIHMCDGLDRNRPKEREVVESNCLAHGRRHIVDEAENFPSECRYVLEQLREVFHNEAVCKEQGWSGQERLEFHQQHSAPIMEDLQAWMKAQFADKRIEPNSGLGDAFKYLLKRWHQLTLFLRVADAPMDFGGGFGVIQFRRPV